MSIQTKKGYLRGCRGILLTELQYSGEEVVDARKHWIDTAQEASVETEIVEGETSELRGGDRLLVQVEDEDVITGLTLDFTDARFDAVATKMVQGGTLIEEDGEIVGYTAPKIADQNTRNRFLAEVYVQSYNSEGGREGYLKYVLPYAKGNFGSITHGDQEWGTPEFSVMGRENPFTGDSCYSKRFTTDLPEAHFSIVTEVDGTGTATVTTSPESLALSGEEVTVTIDDVEAGSEFDSISVTDTDGNSISVTEVLLGEEYTFTMPRKPVTVTVTLATV